MYKVTNEEMQMKSSNSKSMGLLLAAVCAAWSSHTIAAEGFVLRIAGGAMGREIFTPVAPGHYGAVNYTYTSVDGVKGDDGKALVNQQLLTAPAAFAGQFVPVAVTLKQTQKNLSLRYTYVPDAELFGAKPALGVLVGYVIKDRNLSLAATRFPTGFPVGAQTGFNNNLRAQEALNNIEVDGLNDMEINGALAWEFERAKLIAGLAVTVPTGAYTLGRPVNPGDGDYVTLKPSITYGHVFDSGWQLGGRLTLGFNETNKKTNYRSGDFYSVEGLVMKQLGPVGLGFNAYTIRQTSADRGTAVAAHGNRMVTHGVALSGTVQTPIGGMELRYAQDIGGKNTRDSSRISLRLARAF
jgi:hypothetical protein